MLIVTIALGALVAILLVSRVNYLKDHKELEDKFKVAQAYAEDAAKVNAQLTAANKAISAEVVALKEAASKTTAAGSDLKQGTVPPPTQRKNSKLKQASE